MKQEYKQICSDNYIWWVTGAVGILVIIGSRQSGKTTIAKGLMQKGMKLVDNVGGEKDLADAIRQTVQHPVKRTIIVFDDNWGCEMIISRIGSIITIPEFAIIRTEVH